MVPDVAGVCHGEGPKISAKLIGPMDQLVHHHRTGHKRDRLDCVLGYSVLMMSSDSTKRDRLLLEIDILQEFCRTEWLIISVIPSNHNSYSSSELLKGMFAE